MVVNIYVGDERVLDVKTKDNKFKENLKCKQGMIRIFHPVMNKTMVHRKGIVKNNKKHHIIV